MVDENADCRSPLHRAEVGEPFRVEIEGAILEISLSPNAGGAKSISIEVTNLHPSLGFSYVIRDGEGKSRSRGGSAPAGTFETAKDEALESTSQADDS